MITVDASADVTLTMTHPPAPVEDDQRAVADGLAQPRLWCEVELPEGEPLGRPPGRGTGDEVT